MKKIIMSVSIALLIVTVAVLSVMYARERHYCTSLEQCTERQGVVIDSLLNRRMCYVDVELWVTDRSKNVIYGRYNKGNITMPQERKYILVVDSASTKLRYEEKKQNQ